VGLTERQARAAGRAVRTVSYDIGSAAAGALAGTGVHGTAALVIDTTRRVVLGATFVGPGVGEMLHSATIAIVGEVGLDTLRHAVPAFRLSARSGCGFWRPNEACPDRPAPTAAGTIGYMIEHSSGPRGPRR